MAKRSKEPVISDKEAFVRDFTQGTCFWTSEDGDRTDLFILRDPNEKPEDQFEAKVALFREFFHIKGVDWSRHLSRAFVHWGELDKEYWDSNEPPRKGQRGGWLMSESPTDFPVWQLAL